MILGQDLLPWLLDTGLSYSKLVKPLLEHSKKRDHVRQSRLASIVLVAVSLTLAATFAPATVQARAQTDEGQAGYASSCASCHQADGSGIPGTFPPLAGNPAATDPAYVADVIGNGKSGPIEVDGVTYDSVMPAMPALEGAELDAIVAHVVALAGGADTGVGAEPDAADPTAETTVPAEPTVGDPDRGRDLFLGSSGLDNGGGACAACHTAGAEGNLGGRSLGPDLTDVISRLGGEAGLTGWLANPPSVTMTPIFADRPMTEGEIAHLVAYLATTPDAGAAGGSIDRLVVAGVVGLIALFGAMAVAWRGMRQTYVQRLRSRA